MSSQQPESQDKVVHQVLIEAPIQDVWDALTNEGEVLPFFFNSVLHTTALAPGAPVRMRSKNDKYTGVVGEVLELEPPRLYSMTFKFTNFDDPPCKVTHELREVEGGTEYTLTSEGFAPESKTHKQLKQGGGFITKTLKGYVETGKAPMGSRVILGLIGLFEFTSPKQCLTEHWPMDKKI